jgi:PIN domain nuclease of toxin-antitoxin system
MKLLLDTHIWIWSHLSPDRLSRRVRRALESPSNELWLSPISTWELLMLCASGRLAVDESPAAWVRRALAAAPTHEAPVSHDIALAVADVVLPHRDPADRLLVATASTLGLTLVTADRRLLDHAKVKTLAN